MRYGGFLVPRLAVAGLVFSAYMRMRVAVPGYHYSKRPFWLEGILSDKGLCIMDGKMLNYEMSRGEMELV